MFFLYTCNYLIVQFCPDAAWSATADESMKHRSLNPDVEITESLCLPGQVTISLQRKVAMNTSDRRQRIPDPQGLYDPRNEHDACGMGMVASIRGEKNNEIIRKSLHVLINLIHRRAAGCD